MEFRFGAYPENNFGRKMMKKLILLILVLAVVACGGFVPEAALTQEKPTLSATRTLLPLTATSLPTLLTAPILAPLPALPAGEILALSGLSLMDADTGWASEDGGHVLHAGLGGNLWQDVTPAQGFFTTQGFFALDGFTAWAA